MGVGVMGNEGMQAVMSSDFVIGQFRYPPPFRKLVLITTTIHLVGHHDM